MLLCQTAKYNDTNILPAYTLKLGSRLRLVGSSIPPLNENDEYVIIGVASGAVCVIHVKDFIRFRDFQPVDDMFNISKEEAIALLGDLSIWEVIT